MPATAASSCSACEAVSTSPYAASATKIAALCTLSVMNSKYVDSGYLLFSGYTTIPAEPTVCSTHVTGLRPIADFLRSTSYRMGE